MIHSIDSALCVGGDFEKLCTLCDISDYQTLFSTNVSSTGINPILRTNISSISLQQSKLPDFESKLHV
jgi:hypothetical protein